MSESQREVAEAAKFHAEAAKALAEAQNQEKVAASLAAKHTAEASKAEAEARRATVEAMIGEIELAKLEEAEENRKAGNLHHEIYHFTQIVNEASVLGCMKIIDVWRRTKPGCNIEIIFTSPGGSIIDGMALFDYLQAVRREGHCITTGTLGMAASMAGILLQAGETRWMGKEAWVLIHEASFGAAGKIGEVEDTVEWVKKVGERILDIFSSRSTVSKAFIRRNWKRKDWWLSSADCLKYGFVDEVR